ncbi:hypothetical protein ACGFWD_40135 [Streptomyces sp. NPDC048448]|uniref:hypothetical protein n=1 Tax=Streptomyces sp. NPDC048448 TaxID=3365554 RepID=UPI003712BDA2
MTTPNPGSDDGEFVPQYTPPAWYTTEPWNGIADTDTPIPWHALSTDPAPEPGCHICQAHPVAHTEIRSHTGLVLWGRTRTVAEPLCRQCGIALVRTMTTRTLWQGWWGLASLLFHTPVALEQNASAYRKFKALPTSAPPLGKASLAPGKPVLRRPQAYVALIPAAWATALIIHLITG